MLSQAVMLTDTLQMFIFVFGGLLGTAFSLRLVGGLSGLFHRMASVRGGSLEYFNHLMRPVDDNDFPW